MNLDVKIFDKILANQIEKYIKKILHHSQVGFVPRIQGWFNIYKSINMIYYIKKMKNETHMIISIGAEKNIWQNPATIYNKKKTLSKVGIEGTYLNIIKSIHDKSITNILNGEKLKAFSLRSGTRQGCLLAPFLFNMVLEVLATANRQGKEIKAIQIGKD